MFSVASAVGQVDGGIKSLTGMERVEALGEQWEKIEDSLRSEFYEQPKFITLTYEKNGKRRKINNSKFIVLVDSIVQEIQPIGSNQYPMNFEVDTSQKVILKLLIGGTVIQQELSSSTQIQNGATVVFGQITDLHKWFKKGREKPQSQYHELYYVDKLYNSLLTDPTVKGLMLQRKTPTFEYVRVFPRVYGCGTLTEYVKLKEKTTANTSYVK